MQLFYSSINLYIIFTDASNNKNFNTNITMNYDKIKYNVDANRNNNM